MSLSLYSAFADVGCFFNPSRFHRIKKKNVPGTHRKTMPSSNEIYPGELTVTYTTAVVPVSDKTLISISIYIYPGFSFLEIELSVTRLGAN